MEALRRRRVFLQTEQRLAHEIIPLVIPVIQRVQIPSGIGVPFLIQGLLSPEDHRFLLRNCTGQSRPNPQDHQPVFQLPGEVGAVLPHRFLQQFPGIGHPAVGHALLCQRQGRQHPEQGRFPSQHFAIGDLLHQIDAFPVLPAVIGLPGLYQQVIARNHRSILPQKPAHRLAQHPGKILQSIQRGFCLVMFDGREHIPGNVLPCQLPLREPSFLPRRENPLSDGHLLFLRVSFIYLIVSQMPCHFHIH